MTKSFNLDHFASEKYAKMYDKIITLFIEVMPECTTWQNILLYKTVSCKIAQKVVLLHFKTLDFWIKTIEICERLHSIEK